MLNLKEIVFFLTFLLPQIKGQIIPTLDNPNPYMVSVVDKLWEKIKEYGISNLPVKDVSVIYNVTTLGVKLIGPMSLEDGFVQDIDLVSLDSAGFSQHSTLTETAISGVVIFDELKLFRDLRAELEEGMKIGTVVVSLDQLTYNIRIAKGHNNDTVVPTLTYFSFSTISWDTIPDDFITRLIRRQFPMQNVQDLVSTTTAEWAPLFNKFLEEIVQTIDYPKTNFY